MSEATKGVKYKMMVHEETRGVVGREERQKRGKAIS